MAQKKVDNNLVLGVAAAVTIVGAALIYRYWGADSAKEDAEEDSITVEEIVKKP